MDKYLAHYVMIWLAVCKLNFIKCKMALLETLRKY